jgi:pyruvate dehydrogenase E2 component (dihydrolipoamide acetyltransferase)
MTDVVMPQMGESIAEGTIVRWIKKVGDRVERDEPLFEISTDKVDAEIPSPAAGVVSEIRAREGETVPVNSIVAIIGDAVAKPGPSAEDSRVKAPAAASAASAAPAGRSVTEAPSPAPQAEPATPRSAEPPAAPARAAAAPSSAAAAGSVEDVIRQRSSPLVRKIAQEHNVDISKMRGTGLGGRVTKDDILSYIGASTSPASRAATLPAPADRSPAQPGADRPSAPGALHGVPGTTAPMSVMRKKIAEHMVLSRRTSAHVHSVFEVNFGRVAQIREAKKAEYERAGGKLTYLSFILKAVVDALRAVPVVNASVEGDSIVYHRQINVGVAVALDWGLIVPVVKGADEKNLLGLSRAVADLAARARNKQLKPDEVSGGTFTITNPGVFGALFGMPIINQPQVAILGVGNVEKRPVVIDDAIAIRPMAYLSLGYDHRIIDGAVADEFMSQIKKAIENWDPAQA